MMSRNPRATVLLSTVLFTACIAFVGPDFRWRLWHLLHLLSPSSKSAEETVPVQDDFFGTIVAAAMNRTHSSVHYVPDYMPIPYPNGDVPSTIGVCSDEVIRVYRSAGVDLQRLVHEDMLQHFSDYPALWGLPRPDTNIDHRRVPNLATYFRRQGAALPVTSDESDYRPGDIVVWNLLPRPHIGIVVNRRIPNTNRFFIMHNIGRGPELEDFLFQARIVGHFRFRPGSPEAR